MKIGDPRYSDFALCRDMTDAVSVMRNFSPACVDPFVKSVLESKGLFLTGEGSSRLFPAKNARCRALHRPSRIPVLTEGATQALEYDLTDFSVFAASNSGRTREAVFLVRKLKDSGGGRGLFGLTAHEKTPLEEICERTHVLSCGPEGAVAATKSVVEQALFYQALITRLSGRALDGFGEAADKFLAVLETRIDPRSVEAVAGAETVYFAGRNDGVAEELALKTNEIARKKSDFLEGTYAVHGVEEVMSRNDVLVLVDPFFGEEEKLYDIFVRGIGMPVVAIAERETAFPTLRIPDGGDFRAFLRLAAGWNLLVEAGIASGMNIDKPLRARKIGNEIEA